MRSNDSLLNNLSRLQNVTNRTQPVRQCWRRGFGLSGLIWLGACATQTHTPAVWLDASFEELHKAFGDPAAVLINNDNNRVYAFRDNPRQGPNNEADDSEETTQLTYGDGQITVKGATCVVLFELAGQAVTSWDWQGDDCGKRPIPLPFQVRLEGLDRRSTTPSSSSN